MGRASTARAFWASRMPASSRPACSRIIAVFELSHPRYFGLHDPLLGPVAAAGAAHLRHLIIGGRVVVDDGAIPGLDLQQLRHDASRVVARLAA